MSIENNKEMCPSEKNKGPIVVIIEESSKSFHVIMVRNARSK